MTVKQLSRFQVKHHTLGRLAASLIATVTMVSSIAAASAADVTSLRCEYRDSPLGIDATKPRLSWLIGSPKSEISNLKSEISRGQRQTAYQVLVASTSELLAKDQGAKWTSGW